MVFVLQVNVPLSILKVINLPKLAFKRNKTVNPVLWRSFSIIEERISHPPSPSQLTIVETASTISNYDKQAFDAKTHFTMLLPEKSIQVNAYSQEAST